MYPCFLLGIYLHNQPQKLQWLSNHFWLPVAVFLLMLIPWGKPFWDYHEVIQPILAGLVKGQPVDIRPIIFDLYRLVIGMVGSLAFITFFQKYSHIANRFQLTDTLCRWGQYTLQTYILQGVVLETFMARLLRFDGISQDVFSLIVCPVLSVIVLITCVSLTKFISRHSLANLLLFGHT